MTGRFSSPEHPIFQGGRETGQGGIPMSTASFKLNLHHSKSNRKEDADAISAYREENKMSAQKPASFLDSNRLLNMQVPMESLNSGNAILAQEDL